MDNKLRTILFVDNSTRCFFIFRLPVAKAFKALGYDVYVASPAPYEYYQDEITKCGIKHIPYEIGADISLFKDIKLAMTFYRFYKEINPDCVIHYTIKPNIYGTLVARFLKIKSIAVVPGTGSVFQKGGFISRIVELLYSFAFKYPQKVWVLNADDLQAFKQRNIVSADRIEILPGEGVNSGYFATSSEYKKHENFVFLYMGRMLREKGVEYLAQASAYLRNIGITSFEVHLLGLVDGLSKDIISKNEIEEWEKQGLVKYLGSVQDVRMNIESSDCVILPTFYGEGIPRSLMEASSMKRAILTTENVGCRDIVENGVNGILCKSQDVEDLALKMKYMMQLPSEELKKMGENGRQIILSKFEESVIVDKYLVEVAKILDNN
jgi:glycosyltransferase involved in cell wall biosynthesis